MTDFKQQYKNPRPGFGDVDHRRYLRAYNCDKTRKEVRTRIFDKHRDLQGSSTPTSPQSTENVAIVPNDRMKKLIKWREERNRKKKREAATKKPAFKVGVVHHSLCSPIIKSDISIVKTPKKTEPQNHIQKRITRATEKRLLAKAIAAKQPVQNPSLVLIKNSMNIKMPASNSKKPKSFAPVEYCFKPPSGLQKIPLFGLVPTKKTPQEKYISSQKTIQTLDDVTENFRTSINSRLSPNKRNSSQQLNESTIHNSNELNTTITIRSSLEEQAKNQTDMQDSLQEEKSSSNSPDLKTPPLQKSTPTSEKENCVIEDLITFSPYLTRSRGKSNSRKERQQRLGIGRPSDEIPTKDTVMKTLNICVEEEERTAQYFKFLLNKETDRLRELCNKWLDIGLEKDIPEDAIYEIQQAVGQTNLLINKKFERFRGLVRDCETGKGEMLVTCRDLQGFWDMTYMEVKDCDMRFEKLEQRQNREWLEEECPVAEPVAKPVVVKKRMPIKKQIVSSKPSSLRSLILAARKNKMEAGTLNKEDLLLQDINEPNKRKSFIALDENIDTRRSTRRSKSHDLNESKSTPVQRESSKPSSLQKVQFSDKSKRMKSPFAAMKISQMCKTPEVQLDDTVSYVNSDQTPGKSILKKSEELENKEFRIKSAHKVNFDDQIILTEVPFDEDMQTRLNLAAALNRIDSFNLDEIDQLTSPRINAEKRLDFEDSDSSDNLNELEFKTQTIGKRNKSKSSVENILDDIVHPLNDTTSSVSIKESPPNNIEIISSRKSSKNRVQYKDIPKRKNVDILLASPTPTNRDDEMAINAEIISKDMEEFDLGIKILRNRTITANNTPTNSRTSKMITPKRASVSKEGNKSLVKSSRKSSLKLLPKDKNKYMTPNKNNTTEMENVTLTDNIARKKSLRKSVAFDESCVVCTENKPVLPKTPRRSKTPSRQSRSKHAFDENLISWDTPDKKHYPGRVTRSHADTS